MTTRIGTDQLGEPTYANETITPELAAKYHDMYVRNRPIRAYKVRQYGDAMSGVKGKWWLTGETVIFDWDGNPLNGDHRFLACMESGVPFRTGVARGVDPDAFQAIDSTASRQFRDDLAVAGIAYASEAGGLLRKILCWEAARDKDAAQLNVPGHLGRGGLAGVASFRMSRPELHAAWAGRAAEIMDTIAACRKYYDSFPGDRGALLFCWWLLTREGCNPEMTDRFFAILTFGSEDAVANNVLIKLREVLAGKVSKYRTDKMKRKARVEWHTWWILQNWNRWIRGDRLPGFAISAPDGIPANPFPQPQRVR
jgi:hypothetical protein